MLQLGQIYHRKGILYKVDEFKWITGTIVKITFINQSNNQELNLTTTASNFMSTYSLLPTQLELKQE